MKTEQLTNAEYWERYGKHVLMAMPYADQVLVEGRGCIVRDADGNEFLDLASGMFCSVLGHNHPKFISRVVAQTEKLLHTGTQFLSPPVMEAGYKLAQVTPPSLSRSIFFSTGTEANEFAFRIAKTFTGRTGIAGLSRGYYGTSLATKSVSSLFKHDLKDSLPLVPDSFRLPITSRCVDCFTHPAGCDFPCLSSAEEWIGDWSNIAAVIVEPILSAGGMLIPPPGYLAELRRLTRQNGVLLIIDEAQTGFGRTGKWFAFEHFDVEPDILTLSKSIGNGFPAAAVTTRSDIADYLMSRGFWNLSSHQSDPVGAAAVCAVIDIVREDNLVESAARAGQYFMDQLRDLARRQPSVGNLRGLGLMIGFDLLSPGSADIGRIATNFMYCCRKQGVHLTFGYGSRSFRIIPPLVISTPEIDRAIEAMDQALTETLAFKGTNGRRYWPANPQTSRMWGRNTISRVASAMWTSSPKKLFERTKDMAAANLPWHGKR